MKPFFWGGVGVGAPVISSYISQEAYGKIDFISQSKDEFLWLDADIILDTGWEYLFQENLTKGIVCGTPDLSENESLDRLRSKGFSIKHYINSGVLYVNPGLIDKNSFINSILILHNEYEEKGLKYHDQDLLNIVFGDISLLSNRFNYIVDSRNNFINNAFIIHFAGNYKVWLTPKIMRSYYLKRWTEIKVKSNSIENSRFSSNYKYFDKYFRLQDNFKVISRSEKYLKKVIRNNNKESIKQLGFRLRKNWEGIN
jgi:lipopolysaccharide biosynthesis glycosyltransferase